MPHFVLVNFVAPFLAVSFLAEVHFGDPNRTHASMRGVRTPQFAASLYQQAV